MSKIINVLKSAFGTPPKLVHYSEVMWNMNPTTHVSLSTIIIIASKMLV